MGQAVTELPEAIVELESYVEYIRFLTIGENGSGKTPLAASAGNGLLIATEKGTVSAARRGSKMKMWPCRRWEDFDAAKTWLQDKAWEDTGIPFDWVSLDSGPSAQAMLLRHILRVETEAAPTARNRVVSDSGLDLPEIQDHQLYQNRWKRYMEELTDLPVHLCMTAVPMSIEIDDNEGGVEEHVVGQFLGGKGAIAWYTTGLFDCGGKVELRKRKLKSGKIETYQRQWFKKQGSWWGRDRYEVLGDYQDNLTLDKLVDMVNEEED